MRRPSLRLKGRVRCCLDADTRNESPATELGDIPSPAPRPGRRAYDLVTRATLGIRDARPGRASPQRPETASTRVRIARNLISVKVAKHLKPSLTMLIINKRTWHVTPSQTRRSAMIKDILLNLSADIRQEAAANYAISVAGAFAAHLKAITFAYDPVLSATVMGDVLPVDFINAQRALAEEAANAAATKLNEMARPSGVSVETQVETTSFGAAADIFGQFARRFDLSIVGQANPDVIGPQNLIIEAALFQSGRPVVIVPYIQKAGLTLDRVLVCWDGGRQAARAIADALPFLRRAKTVEVVTVAEPLKSDDLPGADIARHLARHDLKADVKRIVRGGTDVADSILSYAADVSADFIVMGGYGHSRLREVILGGTTRGLLSSMTIPTLMSH
jgi:nucleotide-binding universal stress UspA family protein